jgi:beta-glucosidase
MKRSVWIFSLILLAAACQKEGESDRVRELLAKMTLEEKIGQLNQYSSRWEMTGPAPEEEWAQRELELINSGMLGSMLNVTGAEATRKAQKMAVENSRLGIPMIFGYDVIHGYRTMFPIPLGEAATWDPVLAGESARVAATEASAAGVHWTFSPMVDISRDARWGRGMEGYGEDPYLCSRFAYEMVRGYQGDDLAAENTIAACAKHFAGYGFVEAGREYNTVELTENTMRNVVLPSFRACREAGVATFMNAFNEIGGIPCTANPHLVRDILKGEWGFEGFVVSDWNSVGELITHGVAADRGEAARLAIEAGCDMDMEGHCYESSLKDLVEKGIIDEALIDDAVRRILRVKEQLGLFDDPYRYCNEDREKELLLHADHLILSREIAKRSLVLLRNENGTLPLAKNGQRISVIGELAGDSDSPLGNWRAKAIPNSAVSVVRGMQGKMDSTFLRYARGPQYLSPGRRSRRSMAINTTDAEGMEEAVRIARQSDVAVLVLGEAGSQSGEARSVGDIRLKGFQEELLDRVLEVSPHVVVVLMNGRALDISSFIDRVDAVLVAWQPGSESGNAIADVLFGDYNPSGRLPLSWPRSGGQLPIYYNQMNTGRPATTRGGNTSRYTDMPNGPLFPFGFGLSYTRFSYSDLQISDSILSGNGPVKVMARVTNTGDRFGEEVAQLYVRDVTASVTRPVKELKGFRKIGLEPGNSEKVEFLISKEDLYYYGAEGRWGVDPGTIRVWIGPNAAEGLETSLVIE